MSLPHTFISPADGKISFKTKKSIALSTKTITAYPIMAKHLIGSKYTIIDDYIKHPNGEITTVLTLDFDYGLVVGLPQMYGVRIINEIKSLTNKMPVVYKMISSIDPVDKDSIKKNDKNSKSVAKVEGLGITEDEVSKIKNVKSAKRLESAGERKNQLSEIRRELRNDDTLPYYSVNFKFLITAKNIEYFDEFYTELKFRFKKNFPGVKFIINISGGENVFKSAFYRGKDDLGQTAMFTPKELAGYYPFLTQGLTDEYGLSVGEQVGDVNNMTVLWDMTLGMHNCGVIFGAQYADTIKDSSLRTSVSALPNVFQTTNGKPASGNALWLYEYLRQRVAYKSLNPGGRITIIALEDYQLTRKVDEEVFTIDCNHGTINPFESFGLRDSIANDYAQIFDKLDAMIREVATSSNAKQLRDVDDSVMSVFGEVLLDMYRDENMLQNNLESSRNRFSNIYHENVPDLLKFSTYLESAYKRYAGQKAIEPDAQKALYINNLKNYINRLLGSMSDLFNVKTSRRLDDRHSKSIQLYDLSKLRKRSQTSLNLQFINILDLALSNLEQNDTLVIYGGDNLKSYALDFYEKRMLDAKNFYNINALYFFNSLSALDKTNADGSYKESLLNLSELEIIQNAGYVLMGGIDNQSDIEKYNNRVITGERGTDQYNDFKAIKDHQSSSLKAVNDLQHNMITTRYTRYLLRRGYELIVFDANPIIS